jgi:proteasome accessory factor A
MSRDEGAVRPFLMGAETEYGVSGRCPSGALEPEQVFEELADAVKAQRRWVPDRSGYRGMYLENGGRLYLDYGAHPEYATPECATPEQVAACDKAGEALLELARRRVVERHPGWRVTVLKSSLDPVHPDGITFGAHESYTLWVPAGVAGPQLIPHLASRVLYSGAGALTANPNGRGFELSQRARHLHSVVGQCTTGDRPLFGTRIRKSSDFGREGWTRVHLVCKDAQRSPFGVYLTYATTGLLIEMINRGRTVGRNLALADPVGAVKRFSLDPWLQATAPLADGRSLTALEIQLCYLEECERAVQAGGLPDWAPAAVRHWRETLETLMKAPLRLARRLDACCKLLVYEHELLRAGLEWEDLRAALRKLDLLRAGFEPPVVSAVVAGSASELPGELKPRYAQATALLGLGSDRELARLRFALRVQALDLQFHELGGLYDRLREGRRVQWVVVGPADVDRATLEPPPGGRAAARGGWIRGHAGEGDWAGDWQYLWHPPTALCVDLRDPFAGGTPVRTLQVPEDEEAVTADVLELLHEQAAAVG